MQMNKLMQLIKDNASGEGAGKKIRMETQDDGAHIYVYDVIDSYWGANAAALIAALSDAGDKVIHLHINSPGGDVFEARAMSAALVAHPSAVIAHIDGVAASAATYLALAGSEVRMVEGSLFMVHNSWTFTYGNRNEIRKTADLLEKIDGTIAADYMRKTGASAEQVAKWMDDETWFTAAEALESGFVDVVDPNTKGDTNKAKWNLSAYANAPKPAEPPEPDPALTALVAQQLQINRNRMRLLAQ